MKVRFLLFLFPFMMLACSNSQPELCSPNGELVVSFRLTEDGAPEYRVSHGSDSVLLWSPLGLQTEDVDLSTGFVLRGIKKGSHDEVWETVWGEERPVIVQFL